MAAGFFIGGEIIHSMYAKRLFEVVETAGPKVDISGHGTPHWLPGEPAGGDRQINAIVWASRKIAPSVVGIEVTQIQVVRNPYTGGKFFEHFFSPEVTPLRYRTVENIGSGFVISASGMILTNYHVVNNASKLFVNFPDGRRIEGKIVGADDKADLAVISVAGSGFQPVVFGNSDRCLAGEWSIALGNPFLNFINDAHPTVTLGVISALNRNFAPSEGIYYRGMIQTDAAINPGNSGGPLVNTRGEVIGINSFIYTGNAASTGSVGIGFAIPINRARRVADELITYGRRRQVWTGIAVQNVNRAIAASLNIGNFEGVVVANVRQQSPGEAAGLKIGDIIRKMAARDIKNNNDLDGLFLDSYVGDTIDVQFIRNGKHMRTKIILEEYLDKGRK
jgi:serine protease Do